MTSTPPKNKKFLFDLHNFDELSDEERRKKEPPAPTFSLQDMEEARNGAFEKGKHEGAQIAKDSMAQRTEILVQSIAGNLTLLESQENERLSTFEQDYFILVHKALSAVFPKLLEETATMELKNFMTGFFHETTANNGYSLYIHPDMVDAVTPHAKKMHPAISVYADEKLTPSAARIEWTKGTAIWNPEKMANEILDIIARHVNNPAELLDESGKNKHNKGDSPAQAVTADKNKDS